MKPIALLLCVALPAFAADPPSDAPKAETCADGPTDLPGVSVCLEQGQPAPFRARALSFPEDMRRERINERNATFYTDVTKGDVVVVSKPAFYALIAGGTAAVVTAIVLGGLAASHKL